MNKPGTIHWSLCLLLVLTAAAATQGFVNAKAPKPANPQRAVGKAVVNAENRTGKKPQPEAAKAPELAKQAQLKDLFTEQERLLVMPGLGNPVAQLLVLRELNRRFPLTETQRAAIAAFYREEGPQLRALREKRGKQERALEDAIYGEAFDSQAVEQLANEAAITQKELMKRQVSVETRLFGILAQENRPQARLFMALYEQMLGPQRNNVLVAMLISKQYNGQWRLLADFFGEDMDMLIPNFNSPVSFLLILRQLELTPTQKTEFKTLAQEVRAELRGEFEQRAAAQRELPPREAQMLLADRLENRLKMVEEAADQQARAIKRQARIETRFRQILNPQQWQDYTALLRAMLAGNLGGNAARAMLPPVQQPGMRNLQQTRPMLKLPEIEQ